MCCSSREWNFHVGGVAVVVAAGFPERFAAEFEDGAFEGAGIFGTLRHAVWGLRDRKGFAPGLQRENVASVI